MDIFEGSVRHSSPAKFTWLPAIARFLIALCRPVFSLVVVVGLTLGLSNANSAEALGASKDSVSPKAPAIETYLALERKKIPALEKRESLRILYYKPIYFLYQNPLTKVQVSFRAPLSEALPLNFAYSQIIFWELHADSKPFRDATYNPEFFYRYKVNSSDLQTVDFGLWEHNSNGRGGLESRSYDQSYVRFNYAFEGRRWVTQFSAKVRVLYNKDETKVSDIYDYISPLEFQIEFLQLYNSWFDENEVSLKMSPGGRYGERWDQGGYEAGLKFRFGGLRIIPAFYAQYYRGYAETLLNFNRSVEEFRVGLLF